MNPDTFAHWYGRVGRYQPAAEDVPVPVDACRPSRWPALEEAVAARVRLESATKPSLRLLRQLCREVHAEALRACATEEERTALAQFRGSDGWLLKLRSSRAL